MSKTLCKVTAVQTGPSSPNKSENVRKSLGLLDVLRGRTDFVLFPELFTTKYWVTAKFDRRYFESAEPIDGSMIKLFEEKARRISSYVFVPFFEKGKTEGEYYNSVALISPEGKIVEGILPNGQKVKSYRKNHLSKEQFKDLVLDEVSYMKTGTGFPVFATKFGKIGILLCRDRWFPESWRSLSLQGANMIFIATASPKGLEDLFVPSMRVWTRENQVFGIISNKVGKERVFNNVVDYCGNSCIVGPDATVLARAASTRPQTITSSIDLSEISKVRQLLPNYRDRRPEIYQEITKQR